MNEPFLKSNPLNQSKCPGRYRLLAWVFIIGKGLKYFIKEILFGL